MEPRPMRNLRLPGSMLLGLVVDYCVEEHFVGSGAANWEGVLVSVRDVSLHGLPLRERCLVSKNLSYRSPNRSLN